MPAPRLTSSRAQTSSPSRLGPRTPLVGLLVLLSAALTACSGASATPPNWVPQPSFAGDGGGNAGPGNSAAPETSAPNSSSPSSGSASSAAPSSSADDPDVLAKGLTAPIGVALLPDGSALVGQRNGQIVQVQAQPDQPTPVVKTLTGLDSSGDGGLLDLALSPTYAEDRLIYAYVTTPTDNRVIDFTLGGVPTPVFTGIPKAASGNTGRIAFSSTGDLYIGTSDAGQPALASNPTSLAGKVLKVNAVGQPASGTSSPIYTSGHHEVDGLCLNSAGVVFEVESAADEVNQLAAGKNYGWPTPVAGSVAPVATAPPKKGGFGGCAVLGAQLYVTSRDGTDLLGAPLTASAAAPSVGTLVSEEVTKYGRLKTVVAAPDGALWLTTTNKDGKGTPTPDDDRVIRIVPQLGGADSPV